VRLTASGSLVAGGESDSTMDGANVLLQRFESGSTGIEDDQVPEAGSIVLQSPIPNPFSAHTAIEFWLPAAGEVNLGVYDLYGRCIERLVDGSMSAGSHEAVLLGETLPSGIYLVRLVSGHHVSVSVRAVLMR